MLTPRGHQAAICTHCHCKNLPIVPAQNFGTDARTKKLLRDVVDAGQSILARCGGHSFAEYEADRWFRRTVEREFEIIGEALSRLGRSDPSAAAAISELPRIVGFRNRIIRAYDAIDDAAVWGIVTSHLPHLVEEIEMVLRKEGEAL